jgi:hypothetical protein
MSDNQILNGIDIIYWINLDRSPDRKTRMLEMFTDSAFKEIPIKRFSAVDGKNENIDEMMTIRKRKLTNPEYGCLLSHLEIINEFSKTDYQVAMVMEDDITLDFKKFWKKSIRQVIDNAPKDWEIILLCYHSDIHPVDEYTLNENNYWSTGAYIINNAAAKKFTSSTYINGTYHLDDNIKQAADDYLFIKMRTYVYKYPYFIYGYSENTTIPTSNVKYHNYSRRKIEFLYDAEYINEPAYNTISAGAPVENFALYSTNDDAKPSMQILPSFGIDYQLLFLMFLFMFLFIIIFSIFKENHKKADFLHLFSFKKK